MESEQANLGLEQVLGSLRRRAPWILICFVLVAAAAYGVSKHQTKKYTATTSLVFSNNQLAQQVAGLPVASSNSQLAQQNTNLKLVELGDMAEKTASLLAGAKSATPLARGLTESKISESLSVSTEKESNIVNITVTTTSPALTAEIANTYADQFVAEQQSSNHKYYAHALKLVEKQLGALSPKQRAGTAGLALQDRAQSLGVLAELKNGNVEVAKAAKVPTSPSSPKVSRNTVLGGMLGLLLGLGIAFLLERLDRRIREPRDLEGIYGLPLLGVVPESSALARSGRAGAGTGKGTQSKQLPAGEAEAFHLIRAHLRYFNVDRELRTLMVASAAPGDGKTTVARHLAAAAARVGSRVLLLEADLRRPTIAQQLDVQSGPGVSDVLIGAVTLREATQTIDLDSPSGDGGHGRMLDVLVAGVALPPNPGELIESHAMEALLEQAKSEYDLVVIDTPPLTAVSDAFPLLSKVDGVIIVGRVGKNRRDVAQRLHETLTGAGAPLLGVVANGFNARRNAPYSYDYNYSYAAEQSPPSAPAAGSSPNGAVSSDQPAQTVKT
jgi:capsular exopolysaccharide synthesis family protein